MPLTITRLVRVSNWPRLCHHLFNHMCGCKELNKALFFYLVYTQFYFEQSFSSGPISVKDIDSLNMQFVYILDLCKNFHTGT